jgi:hypothetical protein
VDLGTHPIQGEDAQMVTEFVLFRTAGTNEPEPILINPAHVQSWARESGHVDKWIFCLTTARLAEDQEIR